MRNSNRPATVIVFLLWPSLASAELPPAPGATSGDPAQQGMKHVNVVLDERTLSIVVETPPLEPVLMMSGYGRDYQPDKFDVLENRYFNAQHGWLPSGFFDTLPEDASIWIKRTGVEQPAGSLFRVYEAGNMMQGMDSWTMNEIYATDDSIWQWDGLMQHDYFTADLAGEYAISYEVYVGDANGNPLSQFMAASATLRFVAVPEPSTWLLSLCIGISVLVYRRRRG